MPAFSFPPAISPCSPFRQLLPACRIPHGFYAEDMPTCNTIFLIGNLTRDPELKQTPSGKQVTTFGVATSRTFQKSDGAEGERVCFVDVVVWDRLAEVCAQYLAKGKLVFIEGRLEYRTWESEDGKRSKHEVCAKTVQFLSPREEHPPPPA